LIAASATGAPLRIHEPAAARRRSACAPARTRTSSAATSGNTNNAL
jgi:hypothetical protein